MSTLPPCEAFYASDNQMRSLVDAIRLGLLEPPDRGIQTLWDQDLPAIAHSATSRAAAEAMGALAGTLRERVYVFICEHPKSCDERIARGLGMNPSTERPRRIELERAGLIRADGHQMTRAGRRAVAWSATD